MLAINEPIGRYIALANLERNLFHKSIEEDVTDLVDLIRIRIKDKPVDQVADSLLESMFKLRLDLIQWLANNNKETSSYLNSLNEHTAVNLQLAPFSSLAEAISVVLLSYEKIILPIFESTPDSFKDIFEEIKNNKPNYDSFKMLSLHPSPRVKYLKNWIDASLQFDIGLIISDLVMTEQIKFPKKRISVELTEFLYNTITRFGAYSIFTGFWTPDPADTSNMVNRMKILCATIEMDNNLSYQVSSQEAFYKMLHN